MNLDLSGFVFTVFVYIVNLIYLKAASQYDMKMKYLEKKYPERAIRTSGVPKRDKLIRKDEETLLETLLYQIRTIIVNEQLHFLIFRLC